MSSAATMARSSSSHGDPSAVDPHEAKARPAGRRERLRHECPRPLLLLGDDRVLEVGDHRVGARLESP